MTNEDQTLPITPQDAIDFGEFHSILDLMYLGSWDLIAATCSEGSGAWSLRLHLNRWDKIRVALSGKKPRGCFRMLSPNNQKKIREMVRLYQKHRASGPPYPDEAELRSRATRFGQN